MSSECATSPSSSAKRPREDGEAPARRLLTAIELTPLEETIFKTLVDAKEFSGCKTTIRVVGGWVRDKVLGLDSDDIDIALDDMSGADFAECVLTHLKHMGTETSKLAIIERNPEQSKHLETATMKIHGVSIDFVNLRTEEYASGSRIPEIRLGTAEEDALRRDLTINALFYRVEGGEIEDLCGEGLADLEAGIARTPLEPVQTFKDDPLRVLRAVRFACRFDLSVHRGLAVAAASAEVTTALGSKVSRERLGVEVQKMLTGPQPIRALYLLYSMGLWDVVFRMPSRAEDEDEDQGPLLHRGDRVPDTPTGAMVTSDASLSMPAEGMGKAGFLSVLTLQRLSLPTATTAALVPAQSSLLWWAGALLPCRHLYTRFKKASTQTLVEYMHRESLKGLALQDAKDIDVCNNSAAALARAVRQHAASGEIDRVAVGLKVRELRELWRPALLIACATEIYADDAFGPPLRAAVQRHLRVQALARNNDDEPEPEESGDPVAPTVVAAGGGKPECLPLAFGGPDMDFGVPFAPSHEELAGQYAAFALALEAAGLHEAWSIKPFFAGKDMMKQLELVRGPIVKTFMDEQLNWQLGNPGGTSEECLAYLREFKAGV